MNARASAAAGFTLIEIIVAFAVLALGVTLLLGTLSGASRQLRQGGDAGQAALYAQSLLDERIGTLRGPLQDSGSFANGRYRWQLQVTPWQDPRARDPNAPDDPRAARLLHVQFQMTWDEATPAQQLHISSLRLVLPEAGDGRP